MTEEQSVQEQTITFRGKEYFLKDLNKDALRCIDQILDLDKKIFTTGLELEQYQVASYQFNVMLGDILDKDTVDSKD